MASNIPSQGQPWDIIRLLEVINQDTLSLSCVGHACSKGRRCRKPIAQHNITAAHVILADLRNRLTSESELRQRLEELARLTLCRHRLDRHQDQVGQVSNKWYNIIVKELDRRGQVRPNPFQRRHPSSSKGFKTTGSARPNADAYDREQERRQEQEVRDEEMRRREKQRREEQRRGQQLHEEARRRSERERAEQESEIRQRAEYEQARRDQEKARRQFQEQQARERAERARREWEKSWTRYEQDWANMPRVDTSTLDEDIRHSVPWPVKKGVWQEVTNSSVKEFFSHARDGMFENERRRRTLLRKQALRWHEDKLRQFFPRMASCPDVLALANVVMQALNDLTADLGRS